MTMRIQNYKKEENRLVIYGCSTCPFLWYKERATEYGPFCAFDKDVEDLPVMETPEDIPNEFPFNCPLRYTNFKFIRDIGSSGKFGGNLDDLEGDELW